MGCARRALCLFQHALDSGAALQQHWIAILLCMDGQVGHAQMVAFINDAELSELPLLERMCGRFKFTAVAERWTEARHALLRKSTTKAPNHSVVHIAFDGVQPVTREMMKSDVAAVARLAELCSENKTPLEAVRSAGFMGHQTVKDPET